MAYLNRHSIDIGFLQETHLTPSTESRLRAGWVTTVYYSSYFSYVRGVAVVIRRGYPYMLHMFTDHRRAGSLSCRVTLIDTPLLLLTFMGPMWIPHHHLKVYI